MDKRTKPLYSCCLFQSEGALPAQRWAPEPPGEDRRQLLAAAVPGRGPHPERSTQRPAFQTDGGQLLSELLEANPLPGAYRGGGWWRWRLNPKAPWILLIDSSGTRCHLMHCLGLEYMAQEHRSRDHTYPLTPLEIWTYWGLILNFATELFFIEYVVCKIIFWRCKLEGGRLGCAKGKTCSS